MKDCVLKMEVPKENDFITVIRFTVMALAEGLDLNYEDIEDIKIASTEACKIMINGSKKKSFDAAFHIVDNTLEMIFKDNDDEKEVLSIKDLYEVKIGSYVIDSLSDESNVLVDKNGCKEIKIKKSF